MTERTWEETYQMIDEKIDEMLEKAQKHKDEGQIIMAGFALADVEALRTKREIVQMAQEMAQSGVWDIQITDRVLEVDDEE